MGHSTGEGSAKGGGAPRDVGVKVASAVLGTLSAGNRRISYIHYGLNGLCLLLRYYMLIVVYMLNTSACADKKKGDSDSDALSTQQQGNKRSFF